MSRHFLEIKTERIHGFFWGGLPECFVSTALDSGPGFNHSTRYSIPKLFSALYFSSAKDLSQVEIEEKIDGVGEPITYLKYEIDLDSIVDLRDQKIRERFKVTLEEITQHKSKMGAYSTTHKIAKSLYENRYQGLIAPSAFDPTNKEWSNLVIYPANIVRKFIKEKI
ncbi:MAG: RES family NAD+ phosphorylase [Elusimicrobiota bacterium]